MKIFRFCMALIAISGALVSQAQQLSQYSQYMFNQFSINPAVAGSNEKIPVMASFRRQWIGIKDAPVTQLLSAHAYTGEQIGLGLNIFNDAAGPSRRTGMSFSSARHIQFHKKSDTWFSFGLSAIFYQYTFDPSKLTFDQPDDPAVAIAASTKLIPDAGAGAYYYSTNYYIGLSALYLSNNKINLFDINNLNPNPIRRTFFLTAGYDFEANEYVSIEPSFLVRYTQAAPMQLDLNTKVHIVNKITAGLSYRSSDAIVCLLGFNSNSLYFGYTYDVSLNPLKAYSQGTHEIFVGIKLDNAISKDGHHTNHYRGAYKKNPYRHPLYR